MLIYNSNVGWGKGGIKQCKTNPCFLFNGHIIQSELFWFKGRSMVALRSPLVCHWPQSMRERWRKKRRLQHLLLVMLGIGQISNFSVRPESKVRFHLEFDESWIIFCHWIEMLNNLYKIKPDPSPKNNADFLFYVSSWLAFGATTTLGKSSPSICFASSTF